MAFAHLTAKTKMTAHNVRDCAGRNVGFVWSCTYVTGIARISGRNLYRW